MDLQLEILQCKSREEALTYNYFKEKTDWEKQLLEREERITKELNSKAELNLREQVNMMNNNLKVILWSERRVLLKIFLFKGGEEFTKEDHHVVHSQARFAFVSFRRTEGRPCTAKISSFS